MMAEGYGRQKEHAYPFPYLSLVQSTVKKCWQKQATLLSNIAYSNNEISKSLCTGTTFCNHLCARFKLLQFHTFRHHNIDAVMRIGGSPHAPESYPTINPRSQSTLIAQECC